MRRVCFAALFMAVGASCATVDSNRSVGLTPEAGDPAFRLVAKEGTPAPGSPTAPAGELAAGSSQARVLDREAPPRNFAGSPAERAAGILPSAFEDAPVPPAPLPEGAAEEGSGASPVPRSGLTLEQAIGMAMAANPSIAEAEYAVRRTQGEWTQVGLRPNPVAGYMATEVGQEDQVGQQGVFAQQTIVTGDKLNLNRAVSAGDISAARAEAEAQRIRVRADVQARFYEALGAQRLIEIAERTEQNAERSLEATRRLQEAGEATRADVLLAEAVFERSGVSTREAQARLRGAWRQLAAMMGRLDMGPARLEGELETERRPEEFEAIWLRVRSTTPELRRAAARIARARARIARERAAITPDVDAQLAVQQDAATNYTVGMAQIGVMLPVHQRNQGAIAAAQAEYCRAIKAYERLELDLRDRLAQQVRDAEVAAQQVETYGEKVVPAAEEGLTLIREGYERGEFDVLRLVNAQQVYADALREYTQAQIDLQRSLVGLDGLLLSGGLTEPAPPQGVDTPDTLTEVPKAQ